MGEGRAIDQQSVGRQLTSTGRTGSVVSKDDFYVQTQQYNDSASHFYGHNPFANPDVAERYALIYEKAQYECRHVFDPTLTWTPEEKALVRKLDWRCVMFFGLQVDRGNLVQALSDNLLTDLGLTTNDYNTGNTIFLVSFLLAELPSQLVCQKMGPDRWIPMQMTLWSIVAVAQAGLTALSLITIITSILAFGMLHMRGIQGMAGWRNGDMHNRQPITHRRLWNSLHDYDVWLIYILGLIVYIPQSPVSAYITLTLKRVGFSTNIWTLPCVITLRFWPGTMTNAWGTFGVVTTLLRYPYCHAILVGWISKDSNNVGMRTISAALYNMFVQVGGIIGNNIYRADDKPKYRRGNSVLLGIDVLAIILFLLTKVYYVLRNKHRDKVWNAMTKEQRQHYINTTTETGSKRLDFRFAR
ncbi:uncharacterized protein BO97DRAFT_450916 [Aspergillus homomorphus CBS 101889]|uniref:Allantoate permease n=1 Tax=Aspergillus homomorphus (strain CBS 101889) TaxID=1450537 RepID=A0A395HZD6_ASPHC|nr:hypothetical protein BO97DRAFT_450916 [Aspergillus homomorphus CBS 101889]RAL12906.1 hypothetical protein BO97DRAFT_450916 [Aspergillus homomorphus CBS 101889]